MMRKAAFSGIMLTLLIVSMLSLLGGAFNVSMVKATPSGSSEPPATEWNKTYGGTWRDWARSVQQTIDGGYIVAGTTESFGAWNGVVWLVKTDPSGNMQWDKTFGGTEGDGAWSVVQTSDGGYIVAGYTCSFSEDGAAGWSDAWLIKTDSAGNMQWNKTYGFRSVSELARSVLQTGDGGYVFAGIIGYGDFWLVKTDSAGNQQWAKTFGGADLDEAWSVAQTSDGGYIIAGLTFSFPDPISADYGYFWLVKTDSNGNQEWAKAFGGRLGECAFSVVQAIDGGYVIAGRTRTFGDGGDSDFWVIKTDLNGNMEWNKTYGGGRDDEAFSVVQTSDGGYMIAGLADSFGAGECDFWLVKTDSAGNKQWDKTLGGTSYDLAYSIVQTSDGGYVVAGITQSFGAGAYDFWLVKLAPETPPVGGSVISINKLYLLAPWIILATSIAVATVSVVYLSKKRGRKDFT